MEAFRPSAFESRPMPTIWGIIACRAGSEKEFEIPASTEPITRWAKVSRSMKSSTASAPAISALKVCPTWVIVRRLLRSATTPPVSAKTSRGSVFASSIRPSAA